MEDADSDCDMSCREDTNSPSTCSSDDKVEKETERRANERLQSRCTRESPERTTPNSLQDSQNGE